MLSRQLDEAPYAECGIAGANRRPDQAAQDAGQFQPATAEGAEAQSVRQARSEDRVTCDRRLR